MTTKRIFSRPRLFATLFFLSFAWTFPGCALTESDPPPVPHATSKAFAQCRSCHATGESGAPVTDHLQRAECLNCHKPQATTGDQ